MKAQYVGTKKLYDEEGISFNVSIIHKDFSLAGWRRVWVAQLLQAFDEIIGGKKIKVAEYIISKRDSNNIVIATYKTIQKDTNSSSKTVSETIKAMKKTNLITAKHSGVYMVNPNIIGLFGDEGKTIRLMQEYHLKSNNFQ